MYKDKGKQREAVKLATRRYRAKGITKVSQELTPTEKHVAKLYRAIYYNLPEPPAQSYNPMMVGYVPPRGE